MPGRRTPVIDVRRALIDAGHRVLNTRGVSSLTVRAVAAEAGVAPMGVYNHLDGKDGLLQAMVSDGFERLRQATAASRDPAAHGRLRQTGRNYRRFALENPSLYRLMFSNTCGPRGDTGLAALGALTEIIRYGQVTETFRDGDAFELSVAIFSTVHGAMSLELDALFPPIAGIDYDTAFESVLDFIELGIDRSPRASRSSPHNANP